MALNDYQDELTTTAGPPVTSTQSIVGNAATAINGGKVKDGGAAGDWGAGEPIKAWMRVTTAAVGATGGVQFDIVTSAASTLTSPTVLTTKTIATASLTINSLHYIGTLKPGTRLRYLGAQITPLATATTAGSVILFLTKGADSTPQDRVNSI